MKNRISLLFLLAAISTPAVADTVACPDLSKVVQVGACPAEEELRYTFDGYCSDNARAYDKPEKQLCTDFALYRTMKNVALWETPDGQFSGYVNCDPAKAGLAGAVAKGIMADKQGSVTRVTCQYNTAVTFTLRTKTACTVDAKACGADPTACKATCQ